MPPTGRKAHSAAIEPKKPGDPFGRTPGIRHIDRQVSYVW